MQDQPFLNRITLIMVWLNAFTTPLMLSSVNVALPLIASDLSMSAIQISWIPMAYLMASAMFVLIFGKIADMIGRKRVFLIGTASTIISSIIAASSTGSMMLISARFLQGLSAAMLYATQVALITSVCPPKKKGQMIGLTVSAIYLGLTIGPIVGGYVIEYAGWRASLLIHIPLALLVLFTGIGLVKGEWKSDKQERFDLFGSCIYMTSICIFCFSITSLPAMHSVILLLIAMFGFISFFLLERVHSSPLLDITLFFTHRVFTFSCLAALIIYTATFANLVQISLYLQYLKGLSASHAGLIMMCQPLVMFLCSPLVGRISDKIEPRLLASSGMLISCIGLILLSNLKQVTSIDYLVISLMITGFGFSLFSSPNINAIMSSVETRFYGKANGILATMRILGQLSSMILVAFVFSVVIGELEIETANYHLLERAISLSFTIAAALCAFGIYLSMARGRLRQI